MTETHLWKWISGQPSSQMLNSMKNKFPEGLEGWGGGCHWTLLTFATPIEMSLHWPVTTPLMSVHLPSWRPRGGGLSRADGLSRGSTVERVRAPPPLLLLLLFDRRKFYQGPPLHRAAPCPFVNLRSRRKTFRRQIIAPCPPKVTFFYTSEHQD